MLAMVPDFGAVYDMLKTAWRWAKAFYFCIFASLTRMERNAVHRRY